MQDGTRLAAVDLGSNSFRLEIGQLDHGLIRRTDYLKETVRQGGELDADRRLTPQAMQRGWDCLARFAERLALFPRPGSLARAARNARMSVLVMLPTTLSLKWGMIRPCTVETTERMWLLLHSMLWSVIH